MTNLIGIWDFNANGSPGLLLIFGQDTQGKLIVKAQFQDGGNELEQQWTGVWDASARRITLERPISDTVTQLYTGYLGDNHPEIALIFGGSFTESDAGNLQFGWYARWSGPLIG